MDTLAYLASRERSSITKYINYIRSSRWTSQLENRNCAAIKKTFLSSLSCPQRLAMKTKSNETPLALRIADQYVDLIYVIPFRVV
jgi:hypothetical protein